MSNPLSKRVVFHQRCPTELCSTNAVPQSRVPPTLSHRVVFHQRCPTESCSTNAVLQSRVPPTLFYRGVFHQRCPTKACVPPTLSHKSVCSTNAVPQKRVFHQRCPTKVCSTNVGLWQGRPLSVQAIRASLPAVIDRVKPDTCLLLF